MNRLRSIALLACAVTMILLVWAHSALTKDAKKQFVVLSTSDVIGYTSPCG